MEWSKAKAINAAVDFISVFVTDIIHTPLFF